MCQAHRFFALPVRSAALFVSILCTLLATQAVPLAAKEVAFRTGKRFTQTLEEPFSAAWANASLRTILRDVESTCAVAILLDRRIDPSRELSISATGEPLGKFLARLAEDSGADLSLAGNIVYIGPSAAAQKVRTLALLRKEELSVDSAGISRPRRTDLIAPRTFRWQDAETPDAILKSVAAPVRLQIEPAGSPIPYDLWAAADLPDASIVDALSLVLIQFDLTFAWTDRAAGIRLVPVPERVEIERTHSPGTGESPAAALARWRSEWPGLDAQIQKNQVLVRGTIEQHEAIDRPRTTAPETRRTSRPTPALEKKRYTLSMDDTPVSALMAKLAEPGDTSLTFEYDADALRRAGIDLDRPVTINVKTATIHELLKAAFDPVKVAFTIEGRTVRLSPRR